ncbi:hydroxyacylglutathione hydrolase [Microbulbifer sp. VAAF005]|uniref:hydroxyacylglutathione hydrolase n=1 Tax=Microbulbifer sp. VAAF005 TaxID=3034230 RepID=UPI0024ADD764|nr:hydroxyacylglutathione hydrolase [Microbulbifer sp. VAAF005]WHI47805.1 hydroxyacylglutathione hydrolase [Microbulbifer sp. VAAF005]
MLSITPIPAFNDNYIWHLQQDGQHWVVDPGDSAPVEKALQGNKLNGILITHHHYDHTGGIKQLSNQYHCPIYGPEDIPGVTHPIAGGDSLQILGMPLQIYAVPGHTLDHLALVLYETTGAGKEQLHLFCGDTLFSAGCGRLFEGSPEQMYHSLHKLSQLRPATLVYPAHEYTLANLKFAQAVEPKNQAIEKRISQCAVLRSDSKPTLPSTIALELDTNPFLRCAYPDVRQAVAHLQTDPFPENDDVAVFTSLRDWKDNF